MTIKVYVSQLPRPWYVSLTAVWQEATKYSRLKKLVDGKLLAMRRDAPQRAGNHILMPEHCRHFTVLAIMRFNGHPDDPSNMRNFARRVFRDLRNNKSLLEKLEAEFKSFRANVYEVWCCDDATTLQFECGEELEGFRNHARRVLNKPVSDLVRLHTNSEAGR